MESIEHLERVGVDLPARNRVVGSRDNYRFGHPARHCTACLRLRCLGLRCVCCSVTMSRWLSAPVLRLFCPHARAALANRADLARARSLYNQRQFDAAIEAATAAQKTPDTLDPATVLLARAHLERYRERADPADLVGRQERARRRACRQPRRARPRRPPDGSGRGAVLRRRLRRGREPVRERAGERDGPRPRSGRRDARLVGQRRGAQRRRAGARGSREGPSAHARPHGPGDPAEPRVGRGGLLGGGGGARGRRPGRGLGRGDCRLGAGAARRRARGHAARRPRQAGGRGHHPGSRERPAPGPARAGRAQNSAPSGNW